MGQPHSVSKEPSMEEILASIRKIIEETDQPRAATAQDSDAKSAPPVSSMEEVTVQVERQTRVPEAAPQEPEVEAFRKAIHEEVAAVPVSTAPSSPEPRPFTLADVQRRLEGGQPKAAEPVFARIDPVLTDADELDEEDDVLLLDEPVEPARNAGPLDAVFEQVAAAVSATPSSQRTAIISDSTGRQVAGAFDELKGAFMASRQKSFDEMAQEMMQPMLKDWLDNNLPVLVERLVREEIERIARG